MQLRLQNLSPALISMAALAACGGGGSNSEPAPPPPAASGVAPPVAPPPAASGVTPPVAPPPAASGVAPPIAPPPAASGVTPPTSKVPTQVEATVVAKWEASVVNQSALHAKNLTLLGNDLNFVATDSATNKTVTLPCSTGSASASISKAAGHAGVAGLDTGDAIIINYNQCTLDASATKMNGLVKVTLQAPLRATKPGVPFSAKFSADFTAWSVDLLSALVQYDGQVQAEVDASKLSSHLTVPAGGQLKTVLDTTGALTAVNYKANTQIAWSTVGSGLASTSLKVDGTFELPSQPGSLWTIATPQALLGNVRIGSGLFMPVAGSISMTNTAPATSTIAYAIEPNAKTATVKIDVGNNNSTELSFNLTWKQLSSLQ